ncbi:MAG: aminopeptidase P family protein [Deltaproteobacteria bacterium]|nr:aminopeptidase P family protein [Deltaproteobacteria bacterium]
MNSWAPEIKKRHGVLAKKIKTGCVVAVGNREVIRNHDVVFPFRQNSHFLYLTGIGEPGYAFMYDLDEDVFTLFVPEIDAKHIVWVGDVTSADELKERAGAQHVYGMGQFEKKVKARLKSKKPLYFLKTEHPTHAYGKERKDTLPRMAVLHTALSEMRFEKSHFELQRMKKAALISSKAHRVAMQTSKAGVKEYQLQSYLEQVFMEQGGRQPAYGSIVASGKNAAILHYTQNQRTLMPDDFLCIDAACEVEGYAADITRTYPVSGKFSSLQKDLYQVVLDVQKKAIEGLKPGIWFRTLHEEAAVGLLEGLMGLGYLKGNATSMKEAGLDRLFFPHGLGHSLGLDVHDCAPVPKTKKSKKIRSNVLLQENCVVTIEPGIYFIPALINDPKYRKKFKTEVNWSKVENLFSVGGIRIEDDIQVTAHKPMNLTADCPKEIADLENIIGKRSFK